MNRYGHPHEELLERLQRNGVEVMITKESGAITIKTDGKRMVVTRVVTRGRDKGTGGWSRSYVTRGRGEL